MDIGTLEKYMQVHKDIIYGKCKLIDCNKNCDNISIGNNVRIHPRARLIGPAYIGNNVTIYANAVISHSVIGNNISIGAESRVTDSILWNDVNISSKVSLNSSIVTSKSFVSKNLYFSNTVYNRDIERLYRIIS
jgi:mannose-1-phosphate guanylyltransferase